MTQRMKDIVLLGKESIRGNLAGSFPLHQPFVGDGLTPTITKHLGEVIASSTWPYRTAQVPLGATVALRLTPDINAETVRDLVELAAHRTNGDLTSVSIKHSQSGIGDAQYVGCVVSRLSLAYSQSGAPGGASILGGSLNFEAMQPAASSGVSAGTQGAGNRFLLGTATFTVNGMPATEILSYSRWVSNSLALGPPDAANKRRYINDGDQDEEIRLIARFTSTAWQALALSTQEVNVVIVHGTGTANETLTETIGKATINTHQLGQDAGMVTEEITIRTRHTGSAPPTVWTYGSSIGPGKLGI